MSSRAAGSASVPHGDISQVHFYSSKSVMKTLSLPKPLGEMFLNGSLKSAHGRPQSLENS